MRGSNLCYVSRGLGLLCIFLIILFNGFTLICSNIVFNINMLINQIVHGRPSFGRVLVIVCMNFWFDNNQVELKSIIPPLRETRGFQHPFAVKLDKNWTSAFTNSFIPMTSNLLPATVFPAAYNLQLFKTRIHKYFRLQPSP